MLKYYHTKQDHSVILAKLEMKLAWKKPGILVALVRRHDLNIS